MGVGGVATTSGQLCESILNQAASTGLTTSMGVEVDAADS
jgi:hypothetical protein